jgi:lipoate---protein ligase
MNSSQGKQVDFRKYTLPVIDFLSSLGIISRFEGKNDLKTEGLKISGNAEHVYRNRVLHHGTLLFDADLDLMKGSLRRDTGEYETKAVSSNPSSVINLNNVLKNVLKNVSNNVFKNVDDIISFGSEMMNWFLNNYPGAETFSLSEEDKKNAEMLAESKYRSWEWNYGYGPEYHFTHRFEYRGKECFCKLYVKDGIIMECEIKGDDQLKLIGKKLEGSKHMPADIRKVVQEENVSLSEYDIYNFF